MYTWRVCALQYDNVQNIFTLSCEDPARVHYSRRTRSTNYYRCGMAQGGDVLGAQEAIIICTEHRGSSRALGKRQREQAASCKTFAKWLPRWRVRDTWHNCYRRGEHKWLFQHTSPLNEALLKLLLLLLVSYSRFTFSPSLYTSTA